MAILRKFWPDKLYAQLLLVAAVALLAAQLLNAYFLWNSQKNRSEGEAATLLVGSFINRMEREETNITPRLGERRAGRGRQRVIVYFDRGTPDPGRAFEKEVVMTRRAMALAEQSGYDAAAGGTFALSSGLIADMPPEAQDRIFRSRVFRRVLRRDLPMPRRALLLSGQSRNGDRVYAAIPLRPLADAAVWQLIMQTVLLYFAVLVPLGLAARRISRPLVGLRRAMGRFDGGGDGSELKPALEPSGPSDIRDLITAYNELQNRIGHLLSEKDVMLGAIGHDLRTPLASLRLRVENVSEAEGRSQMVESIDEMSAILDDILTLARLGKSGENRQMTDLSGLVDMVLDDFAGQAGRITLTPPKTRIRAAVRPTLMRRVIRNLISNALRYAGDAELSLEKRGDMARIVVEDRGPGIAPDQIEEMFEPFARWERSRNRGSGGSGLGLTIARAIARSHGGDVLLEPRDGGGLRAIVSVPDEKAA